LDAVASSGQSRAEWARTHGVMPRSLNMWRLILARRRHGAQPVLRLVEVAAIPTPPAPVYAVRVGEFRVEVEDDFADATLRRLLAVVASC
jgi:transposase-like protein